MNLLTYLLKLTLQPNVDFGLLYKSSHTLRPLASSLAYPLFILGAFTGVSTSTVALFAFRDNGHRTSLLLKLQTIFMSGERSYDVYILSLHR